MCLTVEQGSPNLSHSGPDNLDNNTGGPQNHCVQYLQARTIVLARSSIVLARSSIVLARSSIVLARSSIVQARTIVLGKRRKTKVIIPSYIHGSTAYDAQKQI